MIWSLKSNTHWAAQSSRIRIRALTREGCDRAFAGCAFTLVSSFAFTSLRFWPFTFACCAFAALWRWRLCSAWTAPLGRPRPFHVLAHFQICLRVRARKWPHLRSSCHPRKIAAACHHSTLVPLTSPSWSVNPCIASIKIARPAFLCRGEALDC